VTAVVLYRTQMAQYAREQVAAAQGVLQTHRTDGAGCCTACGRPAPCPARRDAEQRCHRYEGWLVPQPVFGADHRFDRGGRLVRPYVQNTRRD
jgi:hypothetical protein